MNKTNIHLLVERKHLLVGVEPEAGSHGSEADDKEEEDEEEEEDAGDGVDDGGSGGVGDWLDKKSLNYDEADEPTSLSPILCQISGFTLLRLHDTPTQAIEQKLWKQWRWKGSKLLAKF